MEESISLSHKQHILKPQSIESEELENATLHAKQRAIEARQTISPWKKSQSLYETGGWKSLFENINQPLHPITQSNKFETRDNAATNSLEQVVDSAKLLLCPSGQPEIGNTVVFGVVGGTVEAPSIAYLTESQPVTEEILALSDSVKPTEIFRIASSCQADACKHFDGSDCRLAMRIVQQLPTVVETLPACQIRSSCRWWQQEGKAACYRCPQMVTDNGYSSKILQKVADA
ncbi:hypothetical protein [Nostoc sp. C117]|uniref:hypothetical protein n=1 Tax=Nostoc sp. C117 TaxID=3349875 RepID=UPI00370DA55A